MKTALYYSDAAVPALAKKLVVIDENDDGTLELGLVTDAKKPTLVVGKCPVSTVPTSGSCVVEPDAPAAVPVA